MDTPLPGIAVGIALTALVGLNPVFATSEHRHHGARSAAAADALSEGTVRKVDKAAGKITINHGPMKNLDMPPMTMVFHAGDPAMLDQVRSGDRIRFVAERVGGVFTVTRLELVR